MFLDRYDYYRDNFDRALSAGLVLSGLTLSAVIADYKMAEGEISHFQNPDARRAIEITRILNEANNSLRYTPESSSILLVGQIPIPIYTAEAKTDTNKAIKKIKEGIELMQGFPADSIDSQQILKEAEQSLPALDLGQKTYVDQINMINLGSQRFSSNLEHLVSEDYVGLKNICDRQFRDALFALVSGIVFTGIFLSVLVIGELKNVIPDMSYIINRALNRI